MNKTLLKHPLADPSRHQFKLLRIVLIVIFTFSTLVGSINLIFFNAFSVATFNFISVIASILIGYYFKQTHNLKVASWLLIAAVLFNLSAFLWSVKGAAYSVIWITVLPPLAFFLLGRSAGSWVTGIAFLSTILFLVLSSTDLPPLEFTTGAILNISEVLIILWLLFRFYEGSRQDAFKELERLSEIDKLTGVYNRSKLDQLLENNIELAARTRLPLVVVLIDIDHFKQVNDRFGHLQGDTVLQNVAATLRKAIRSTDIIGRWGGEEFLVLLPNTTLDAGVALTEKLRTQIANLIISDGQSVTLSCGLTEISQQTKPSEAIRYADIALYQAKNNGRNCVMVYPHLPSKTHEQN